MSQPLYKPDGHSPVLTIAYTNHALDHILRDIHDTGVTKDMLRFGSRSKDEVVSQFSLDTIERSQVSTPLHNDAGRCFRALKLIEQVSCRLHHHLIDVQDMEAMTNAIRPALASDTEVMAYLESQNPVLWASISHPAPYIRALYRHHEEIGGSWNTEGRNKRVTSLWGFWKASHDLDHLKALEQVPVAVADDPMVHLSNQFDVLSVTDETPRVRTSRSFLASLRVRASFLVCVGDAVAEV